MKSGYTPSINEDYEHLTKAGLFLCGVFEYINFRT